jgi:hypothetical protein
LTALPTYLTVACASFIRYTPGLAGRAFRFSCRFSVATLAVLEFWHRWCGVQVGLALGPLMGMGSHQAEVQSLVAQWLADGR